MLGYSLHLHAYKDGTEYSETSAYKIQTPGNYPEENIQHSEHAENLKSRLVMSMSVLAAGVKHDVAINY